MGAQQSKVRISTPQTTCCFPAYDNEADLFETVKHIENCHLQAVQVASWIGTVTGAPCTPVGQVSFTAATILFTFLIYRITAKSSNLSDLTGNNNNSILKTSSDSRKSLEDALIDSKVSAAIAKKSVCELQAKVSVINNRYQRLLSDISVEDRRLEVVPAIQTCEEVLQLFHDPSHIFRLNPLVSTPFLVTFSGIFVAIAELSLVLIPSYKGPLVGEMNLLIETLSLFRTACVQTRIDGLKFRRVQPESMLSVVAGGMSEMSYRMEDACLRGSINRGEVGYSRESETNEDLAENLYQNANEAVEAYRKELEDEYERFFKAAMDTISKFSAFENNARRAESNMGNEVFMDAQSFI